MTAALVSMRAPSASSSWKRKVLSPRLALAAFLALSVASPSASYSFSNSGVENSSLPS